MERGPGGQNGPDAWRQDSSEASTMAIALLDLAVGEARAQVFARSLVAKGYRALLVRSFALGAPRRDLNLVLWQWGDVPPARLRLIDDEEIWCSELVAA